MKIGLLGKYQRCVPNKKGLRMTDLFSLAGVPGFEPDLQVLETYVLATDTTPLDNQRCLTR